MNISNTLRATIHRLRSGGRQDPARYWFILMTLFLLALVCVVVWNVWAFDTVAAGGSIGSVATSSPPLFNRSSIDTINNIFEMRATEDAKYVTSVYTYRDPSQ